MPILLAVAAAAMFGTSDFLGGFATRRAAAVSVVIGSQLAGLAVIALAAPLATGSPLRADMAWGAAAGAAGGVALVAFYHGIATTRVGVVAPVGAVVSTLVQVLFGIGVGERPSTVAWLGVVAAVPALVLITAGGDHSTAGRDAARSALLLGIVTGIGFGLFGVCISRTGDDAGLWPLLSARWSSIGLLVVAALVLGRPLLPGRRVAALAAAAGALDMVSNGLYLLAVRSGLLSLVSVVLSLYPAVTLLLARLVFSERIAAVQGVGLLLAGLGVGLIAAG